MNNRMEGVHLSPDLLAQGKGDRLEPFVQSLSKHERARGTRVAADAPPAGVSRRAAPPGAEPG
jgi:hypothetical protein